MKDYHDLKCCPKCGNIDILQRTWTYVNNTIDTVNDDVYKCPDCGEIDEPVSLDIYCVGKVVQLLKEDRIFIYEQPCGAVWCAFNDYNLLREIWEYCIEDIYEFFRLYDDGGEGAVDDKEDLEESIEQGQTIGFEIRVPANRPSYCIPAIAEKIYPYFLP